LYSGHYISSFYVYLFGYVLITRSIEEKKKTFDSTRKQLNNDFFQYI